MIIPTSVQYKLTAMSINDLAKCFILEDMQNTLINKIKKKNHEPRIHILLNVIYTTVTRKIKNFMSKIIPLRRKTNFGP